MSMKISTAAMPSAIELRPVRMASSPSEAPIACWLRISSGTGRAPVSSTSARSSASLWVNPVTCTWLRIGSEIVAAALTRSSSTTAMTLPTFSLVSLKKMSPPSPVRLKITVGCWVMGSRLTCAC